MTIAQLLYILVGFLTFFASTGYVVRYHIVSRGAWREREVGRHLMSFAVVLALNVGFTTFNLAYSSITGHSYAARVPIGTVLFLGLAVVVWHRWIVFERTNRQK